MDVTLFKTFLSIARMGSFSDAARLLNASQSTISGHIAKLEEQFQTQLFARTTRKCELTEQGREFVSYASSVVNAFEELNDAFHPNRTGGVIRLGVPDDYHLFSRIAVAAHAFVASRPKFSFKIVSGLSANHRRMLHDGHLDLAILRRRLTPETQTAAAPMRLVWVGAPSLDLVSLPVLPLAHIDSPCLYFAAAKEALNESQRPWRSICSCSTLESVRSIVEAGIAVAAIPEPDFVQNGLQRLDGILPPLPEFTVTIEYASDAPPVIVRALARVLSDALGELGRPPQCFDPDR